MGLTAAGACSANLSMTDGCTVVMYWSRMLRRCSFEASLPMKSGRRELLAAQLRCRLGGLIRVQAALALRLWLVCSCHLQPAVSSARGRLAGSDAASGFCSQPPDTMGLHDSIVAGGVCGAVRGAVRRCERGTARWGAAPAQSAMF